MVLIESVCSGRPEVGLLEKGSVEEMRFVYFGYRSEVPLRTIFGTTTPCMRFEMVSFDEKSSL